MEGYPYGHSYALLTMLDVLYPSRELVCTLSSGCCGDERVKLTNQLAYLVQTVPGLAVIVKTEGEPDALKNWRLYTRDYPIPEGGNLVLSLRRQSCMPPVPELSKLYEKLKES